LFLAAAMFSTMPARAVHGIGQTRRQDMKAVVITGVAALALSAGLTSADETLARKNACMSCHQTAKKVVGPAFRDVARKYRGDARAEAHLLAVIKQGGKGVWGDIPMPPQPRISDADARRLVHWVLAQ